MNNISHIIKSKDNQLIKHIRKLITSKKERMLCREFVLEGSRLVFDALKNNVTVSKIFVTDSALLKYKDELLKYNCGEIIHISDELGKKISDTDNTQGIFAQCGFLEGSDKLGNLRPFGKYVVLSGLQDPGNAGMIIRTADAMGIDGVIFSKSCDIYNPKVVRATMGSLFRIPVFADIDEDDIFLALSTAKISSYAAVVNPEADDLKSISFINGGAIFIGNEGNGLLRETIDKCDKAITIKMNGNIESLNAAMATGIIMWELTR